MPTEAAVLHPSGPERRFEVPIRRERCAVFVLEREGKVSKRPEDEGWRGDVFLDHAVQQLLSRRLERVKGPRGMQRMHRVW